MADCVRNSDAERHFVQHLMKIMAVPSNVIRFVNSAQYLSGYEAAESDCDPEAQKTDVEFYNKSYNCTKKFCWVQIIGNVSSMKLVQLPV